MLFCELTRVGRYGRKPVVRKYASAARVSMVTRQYVTDHTSCITLCTPHFTSHVIRYVTYHGTTEVLTI